MNTTPARPAAPGGPLALIGRVDGPARVQTREFAGRTLGYRIPRHFGLRTA